MIDAKTARSIFANYNNTGLDRLIDDEIIEAATSGEVSVMLRGPDVVEYFHSTDVGELLENEGYRVEIGKDCVLVEF